MITFNTENIERPDFDTKRITKWIEDVASSFGKNVGTVNYIFTDDDNILKINKEFLQHDYYTDIITFDYSRRKTISGDIYISVDTVRTNAELQNVDYEQELMRVIIHGILHLCGINDKGPGEREIMESHENVALSLLGM